MIHQLGPVAPDIEDLKSEIATNFRKVFEARYND